MNFPFSQRLLPKPDAPRDDASPELAPVAPSSSPMISEASLPPALRDDLHFFRTLCTRLWRFERQLAKVAQTEPSDNHDRLTRRFESIIEALREAKIEIIDHDGEKYDSGLNLSVLQFEPREELQREMVIETVKPSLVVRGIRIPGEVIVGQPIVEEAEPVAENAESSAENEELSTKNEEILSSATANSTKSEGIASSAEVDSTKNEEALSAEADSTTVERIGSSAEADSTKNESDPITAEADSTKNEAVADEVAPDTEENR